MTRGKLYINTAVTVALTFTSVFLQNIAQQHEDGLEKCLGYVLKIDGEIELSFSRPIGRQQAESHFQDPTP